MVLRIGVAISATVIITCCVLIWAVGVWAETQYTIEGRIDPSDSAEVAEIKELANHSSVAYVRTEIRQVEFEADTLGFRDSGNIIYYKIRFSEPVMNGAVEVVDFASTPAAVAGFLPLIFASIAFIVLFVAWLAGP